MSDRRTVSLYLDPGIYRAFREACEKRGVNVSQEVESFMAGKPDPALKPSAERRYEEVKGLYEKAIAEVAQRRRGLEAAEVWEGLRVLTRGLKLKGDYGNLDEVSSQIRAQYKGSPSDADLFVFYLEACRRRMHLREEIRRLKEERSTLLKEEGSEAPPAAPDVGEGLPPDQSSLEDAASPQ